MYVDPDDDDSASDETSHGSKIICEKKSHYQE